MARQVVIENPILNAAFEEPARHFEFADEGITDEVIEKRRVGARFVPVPSSRKKGRQTGLFDTEWTEDDLLSPIIEVTGQKRKDKEAKVATARDMWVPAINNHGGFGRWLFIETRDPWNAQNEVRTALQDVATPGGPSP